MKHLVTTVTLVGADTVPTDPGAVRSNVRLSLSQCPSNVASTSDYRVIARAEVGGVVYMALVHLGTQRWTVMTVDGVPLNKVFDLTPSQVGRLTLDMRPFVPQMLESSAN